MSVTWKLTAFAKKTAVQAALLAHEEIEDWDPELVISGSELDEKHPNEWVLEGWYPRKPTASEKLAIASLFSGRAPAVSIEKLPPTDWLSLSQQGAKPMFAGPFHVHTPDFDPAPEAINFTIPAAQAFGTGQHETTAGCLEMLAAMKRTGMVVRNAADIGTGTGLLGFAAMKLWPTARMTASDIDPVCAQVVQENAALNAVPMGAKWGEMAMVIADGMDDRLLQVRGPYDLLIANILAGPLVELAPDFSASTREGGSVLLAGLLTSQEERVRRAYRRAGMRMTARLVRGDWSILWFRKRALS
ncbi:MAG: 50S ribosomal protein L11 methyltransferase [Pseudomonadota bacterium]